MSKTKQSWEEKPSGMEAISAGANLGHHCLPFSMGLKDAARYLGISPSFFSQLVDEGRMPRPRALGARRLWGRYALEHAFEELPEVSASPKNDDNPWLTLRA